MVLLRSQRGSKKTPEKKSPVKTVVSKELEDGDSPRAESPFKSRRLRGLKAENEQGINQLQSPKKSPSAEESNKSPRTPTGLKTASKQNKTESELKQTPETKRPSRKSEENVTILKEDNGGIKLSDKSPRARKLAQEQKLEDKGATESPRGKKSPHISAKGSNQVESQDSNSYGGIKLSEKSPRARKLAQNQKLEDEGAIKSPRGSKSPHISPKESTQVESQDNDANGVKKSSKKSPRAKIQSPKPEPGRGIKRAKSENNDNPDDEEPISKSPKIMVNTNEGTGDSSEGKPKKRSRRARKLARRNQQNKEDDDGTSETSSKIQKQESKQTFDGKLSEKSPKISKGSQPSKKPQKLSKLQKKIKLEEDNSSSRNTTSDHSNATRSDEMTAEDSETKKKKKRRRRKRKISGGEAEEIVKKIKLEPVEVTDEFFQTTLKQIKTLKTIEEHKSRLEELKTLDPTPKVKILRQIVKRRCRQLKNKLVKKQFRKEGGVAGHQPSKTNVLAAETRIISKPFVMDKGKVITSKFDFSLHKTVKTSH